MNPINYFLSKVYLKIYWLWRFLLFINFIPKNKFKVKIISIGNISAGGSGKTPMVQLLSQKLTKNNISHCIVSRGYKKTTKGLAAVSNNQKVISRIEESGDEPFMLAQTLLHTPVVVGNKKDAINLAIKNFNPQLILLDDGFQSLKIKRDCDIVLIDASKSLNNYKILPWGFLREPLSALSRANAVVYTKTNFKAPGFSDLKNIINKNINVGTSVFESTFEQTIQKYSFKNKAFNNKNIKQPGCFVGCSGVSNNALFKKMVLKSWSTKNTFFSFSDHHNYSKQDIRDIKKELNKSKKSCLITTKKDFYKIYEQFKKYDLFVLDVEHKIKNVASLVNLLKK